MSMLRYYIQEKWNDQNVVLLKESERWIGYIKWASNFGRCLWTMATLVMPMRACVSIINCLGLPEFATRKSFACVVVLTTRTLCSPLSLPCFLCTLCFSLIRGRVCNSPTGQPAWCTQRICDRMMLCGFVAVLCDVVVLLWKCRTAAWCCLCAV
jgi:hypothetical protein